VILLTTYKTTNCFGTCLPTDTKALNFSYFLVTLKLMAKHKRSIDNFYIMLFASGRTGNPLSDPARRQRANHKLACSWRLPATNAKGAKRISHGAANN